MMQRGLIFTLHCTTCKTLGAFKVKYLLPSPCTNIPHSLRRGVLLLTDGTASIVGPSTDIHVPGSTTYGIYKKWRSQN